MENINVMAYNDGDDFVLYFKNCSPDMKKFLTNMLNPLLCGDSQLEQVEKETVDPVIPEGCGRYTGKRVSEVLIEDGNKGYAVIAYILGQHKFSGEADVRELLSQYLFDTFSFVDPMEYAGSLSEEQADEWLKCFDSLVTPSLKQKAKNLTGFESYEEFLKDGTKEQKVSMVYNIIVNMGFSVGGNAEK